MPTSGELAPPHVRYTDIAEVGVREQRDTSGKVQNGLINNAIKCGGSNDDRAAVATIRRNRSYQSANLTQRIENSFLLHTPHTDESVRSFIRPTQCFH